MKIILLEDDVKLGDKGSIVQVKRGFGMNFLIPQKKAVMATEGNISMTNNMINAQKKKVEKEKQKHLADAEKIKTIQLEFEVKAAVSGHIFGTITTEQVVEQLKEKAGIEISKKKVAISTHIKLAGTYSVKIKLFTGVDVVIPLVVTVEKEDEEALRAEKAKKKRSYKREVDPNEEVRSNDSDDDYED